MADDERREKRKKGDTMPALQLLVKHSELPPPPQQQQASRLPSKLARPDAALDEEEQARRATAAAGPKNSELGAPASEPSERPGRAERRPRRLGVLAAALVAVAGSTPTSKDQDRIGTPREVEVEIGALETESRTGVPNRKERSTRIPHSSRTLVVVVAAAEGNWADTRTPAAVADCAVPRTAAQVAGTAPSAPSASARHSTRH